MEKLWINSSGRLILFSFTLFLLNKEQYDFGGFELRREEKILGFRAEDLGVLCWEEKRISSWEFRSLGKKRTGVPVCVKKRIEEWKNELKSRTVKYVELVNSERFLRVYDFDRFFYEFDRVWPGFGFSTGLTGFSEPTRKIVRFCELARDFDYLVVK